MPASNARKKNASHLDNAERMNLVTLVTPHRGVSTGFIEDVYPYCEKALEYLKETNPVKGSVFQPRQEVAFVVEELGWGYWTGVASSVGNKVVLRGKDLTWTMTLDRAIFEDRHGNMRSFRKAILHDKDQAARVRVGWELVNSRVYRDHSNYNAPLSPAQAIQWLINVLRGQSNNSPGLELRETDWSEARQALTDSKVSEFAEPLESWLLKDGNLDATYKDALAAGEYWHGMVAMLRKEDPIGDHVYFGRMFLTMLLAMSRHVDDKLQSKLFSLLRRHMNCLSNPEMGATPRSVYSYGEMVFEAVDKVHRSREARMVGHE